MQKENTQMSYLPNFRPHRRSEEVNKGIIDIKFTDL